MNSDGKDSSPDRAALSDVLGVGANSVDHVYRLPDYPTPAGPISKVEISRRSTSCGGQTATTLCTCAAFGRSTRYIGAFGEDEGGGSLKNELAQRGVDIRAAVTRHSPNAYAVILIDERQGERVVLWSRDPLLALRASEIPAELVERTRLLHVDDVDEESAIRAAHLARAAGIPTTSDIERVTERTAELAAAVTVPIFAADVPGALTGEGDPERALRTLRRGHGGLLCVTLGAEGAMLLDGDRLHHVRGHAVDIVDSTGAGDVFRGAFIHAMLDGASPEEILRFANAAAALSCTRRGAIASIPSLADVRALLRL